MRLYTQQHRHYCGIDLHTRSLNVCILDKSGKTLVHQKLACEFQPGPRGRPAHGLEAETVQLSRLPCWKHLAPEAYRNRIAEMVQGLQDRAPGVSG